MSEHSRVDRLPVKLSPSRAKDFQRCPQLYWFKTVHGCVTPPTVATIRGTMFHTVLERFFDLSTEERTPAAALAFVAPAWDTMVRPLAERAEVPVDGPEARLRDLGGLWSDAFEGRAEAASRLERRATEYAAFLELEEQTRAANGSPVDLRSELIAQTASIVTNYFEAGIEDAHKLRTYAPAERELYVEAEVDGVPLHGFIDRLDHFTLADGTDRWLISDYKTGKPHQERYKDDAYFAMWVYALLLRETRGVRPDQLRLLYAGAPSKTEGDRREPVTDEGLARASQRMRRLWDELRIAHDEERFEARRGRLCDWCYFQHRGCSAFGGTPEEAPIDWIDAALAEADRVSSPAR